MKEEFEKNKWISYKERDGFFHYYDFIHDHIVYQKYDCLGWDENFYFAGDVDFDDQKIKIRVGPTHSILDLMYLIEQYDYWSEKTTGKPYADYNEEKRFVLMHTTSHYYPLNLWMLYDTLYTSFDTFNEAIESYHNFVYNNHVSAYIETKPYDYHNDVQEYYHDKLLHRFSVIDMGKKNWCSDDEPGKKLFESAVFIEV